ncbi:hypothetical protein CGRA01v4_06976 [Colletotrichum graminicola]|nr:hypothetical protein CGRA01v4_06976 [Colletotrichum graminicola]
MQLPSSRFPTEFLGPVRRISLSLSLSLSPSSPSRPRPIRLPLLAHPPQATRRRDHTTVAPRSPLSRPLPAFVLPSPSVVVLRLLLFLASIIESRQ